MKGREEIIDYFNQTNRFASKEVIQHRTKLKISTISRNLCQMRKDGEFVLYKNRYWGVKMG